jgi:predicted  nucleic acid-binding Zn-ribbon protein
LLIEISKLRAEQSRILQDHQRQLEHVQNTAEANADRTRKRMEAEIADLQSHVTKLEADLSKVRKPKSS